MSASLYFATKKAKTELAILWKMELQYYGKMFCNFLQKVLAKNNYHIACDKQNYSVPFEYIGKKVVAAI